MPLWSTFCDVPRYGSSAEFGGPSASAKFNEGIGLFDFNCPKGLKSDKIKSFILGKINFCLVLARVLVEMASTKTGAKRKI